MFKKIITIILSSIVSPIAHSMNNNLNNSVLCLSLEASNLESLQSATNIIVEKGNNNFQITYDQDGTSAFIIIQHNNTQDRVSKLIDDLKNILDPSVKIKKVDVNSINLGTQDDIFKP